MHDADTTVLVRCRYEFSILPFSSRLYSDPDGCVDLTTFTSLSKKVIDLSSASISYIRVLSKADKYSKRRLTLLLLALTPPLLPAIQVCSDFAAFEHASFARKSPVVAKHANRDDRAGRQGGGTVSDNQLLLLRHFLLPRSFLLFAPLRAML